ncbi:hypothetical protein SY83_20015 [Paenibacillus swuensis]|uniref:AraC family transcriptional regulator n=1 Tax=Paenibacillus swuensis TaxID=1178515 RepID=A0A172TMD8_9BACL|nr:response regulator [Paenibacillus swuensis]ANE48198.1 hypothetical protein SY83_20015 [Paenibacillus swuensis]
MHRILIVDDEAIFRKGLSLMINSSLGLEWEIVGEAADGYEALQMVEERRPDVVLTDIRMPRMDGVQLQQIVKERFPEVLIIVLSGYDDFSYMQQSLRNGVRDYLMKPVEREELFNTLGKLKQELLQETRTSGTRHAGIDPETQAQPKDEKQMRQHASEHLVTGLLRGYVTERDMELLDRIGVHLDLPFFSCMIIKLDKDSVHQDRYNQADPSLFQLYIQQVVQELLNQRTTGFCFILSETEVVALLNLQEIHSSEDMVSELAEGIRRRMISLSSLTVTIGIGRTVQGIHDISRSFNEAKIALLYRLILGGDRVLRYDSTAMKEELAPEVKPWSWESLEASIHEGKTEETERRVQQVITELCQHAKNPEVIQQQICKLLLYYYELAEKLGIGKQWLGEKNIQALLFEICAITARSELIDACRETLGQLTRCVAESHGKTDNDPIHKAIEYLARHYQEPVTLKEVADQVYLNPAYFSTLFKQRTGKSFVEYWTDMRVDDAKKRLAYSNEKIAVIAERTGFSNIRHFNRVFKNITGTTPNHYRDHVRAITEKPGSL